MTRQNRPASRAVPSPAERGLRAGAYTDLLARSPALEATDEDVMAALRVAAEEIVGRLVVEEVQAEINDSLVKEIAVRASPDAGDIAAELEPSTTSSAKRFADKASEYTGGELENRVASARAEMEAFLSDGEWVKRFPGRLIPKRFEGEHLSVGYEPFRNLVLETMVTEERKPENVRKVLGAILESE
jgi:hypothetical protein